MNIFGPGFTQAVAYWAEGLEYHPILNPNAPAINPIGLTESDSRFTWTASAPASNFVVYTSDADGNINETPILGTTTIVPEPISSTLFFVGGGVLGLRRFWKKRRPA